MSLSDAQRQLLADLRAVQLHLREETKARHARINPFAEDLTDWHERAAAWTGDNRGVVIYDSTTVAGDVTIGESTWIGPFCSLDGTGGLTIGAWCSISAGVQLLTHDTVRRSLTAGAAGPERSPVRIGDRCFIGTHAVVTRGVVIGDGCVVAAGAVVVADVEAGAIVAGAPARRIGTAEVVGDHVHLRYDVLKRPDAGTEV
jgi:acetyltransferase-like isoleucine patch superfamily enzyme